MHLNTYYLGHYEGKEVVFRYGKKISLISTAIKKAENEFHQNFRRDVDPPAP